jgi:hypothetical protein
MHQKKEEKKENDLLKYTQQKPVLSATRNCPPLPLLYVGLSLGFRGGE